MAEIKTLSNDVEEELDKLSSQISYLLDENKTKDKRLKILENHIVSTTKSVMLFYPEEYIITDSHNEKKQNLILVEMEPNQKNKASLGLDPNLNIEIDNSNIEEIVTPFQFIKRMFLIAYASFRYPSGGDVYINFKTSEMIHNQE